MVVRLEIDDADAVELAQALQQRPVPVLLGVELELEAGRELEPPLGRGARRDGEADGQLLAPERLAEGELVLAKRKIEDRALEGPASEALARAQAPRRGWRERSSMVHVPASISSLGTPSCSSASYVTSSPSPVAPSPSMTTVVVTRVQPDGVDDSRR